MHVILYRVLGSNADMEDLLQETFIEIFRSIPSFRGEAALGTWLDRIAVRVAYAHLTRRRVEVVRLSVVPEPMSREPGADERAMTREAAAHLYEALDRVPAAQRIAFTLHVVDGRPVKQVAQTMEASRRRHQGTHLARLARDPAGCAARPAHLRPPERGRARRGHDEALARDAPSRPREIELEPLSEARWARVERAVLDASVGGALRRAISRRTRTPRWRLAAGSLVLAGALAAIAGGFAWRALQPEARGGADARRDGGQRLPRRVRRVDHRRGPDLRACASRATTRTASS